MICLPLLYLGFHWASDVVAGAVFGVVLMLLLRRPIGATGLPDRVVRFSATHPPAFYAIAWLFALQIALLFGDVRELSFWTRQALQECSFFEPSKCGHSFGTFVNCWASYDRRQRALYPSEAASGRLSVRRPGQSPSHNSRPSSPRSQCPGFYLHRSKTPNAR